MLEKGYLQSSRGSPAAQQDIYMDMIQQHGTWSPWGAWAWASQGIWWLPCPHCWGITTSRGLWPQSMQSRQVQSSLFYLLEKFAWIFTGIKVQISAAQTVCRQVQIPTSNLRLLEKVLVFYIRQRKSSDIFFLSLGARNGQTILTEAFGVWRKINW